MAYEKSDRLWVINETAVIVKPLLKGQQVCLSFPDSQVQPGQVTERNEAVLR